MSIAAVFEKLGSRFRERKQSAQETIEKSAKSLAAGETVDTGAVETALVAAGLTLDDYRARVDFHVERKTRLDELDKLGAARKRVEELDAKIEAENKKHGEIVEAYRKRWLALREQVDEEGRQVERSRTARDWLLDPKHAPLFLRDDYVAALDREQAAQARIGDVERLLRDLREKHRSAIGWIEQLLGEDVREIYAPSQTITTKQRGKLGAATEEKISEHERRRDRLAREIAQAEKDLEAARGELAQAEAVLVDLRKRILKS